MPADVVSGAHVTWNLLYLFLLILTYLHRQKTHLYALFTVHIHGERGYLTDHIPLFFPTEAVKDIILQHNLPSACVHAAQSTKSRVPVCKTVSES